MAYYLVYKENTFRLIPVRAEQEEAFCRLYAQQVLASGESPLEALRAFDALPLVFCDGLRPSLFLEYMQETTLQIESESEPENWDRSLKSRQQLSSRK